MIQVLSFTETGGHPVNEDAFLVRAHPADPGCWLVCLADGQGGRAGGARAARLACETALGVAAGLAPGRFLSLSTWPSVLREADRAVEADAGAGFTTLVGFSVLGDRLAGASGGDSAVLAVEGDAALELTASQHKDPPVGSGAAVFVPFARRLAESWVVLALSDGVWKYAGWQRVADAARRVRGQGLLDALQAAARLPGSGRFPDDFTVVLLEDRPAG